MADCLASAVETTRIRTGPDSLDASQLNTEKFWQCEQGTLLGRVYDHWMACRQTNDEEDCLPLRNEFNCRSIAHRQEDRFIISVDFDRDDFPKKLELDEKGVVGRENPFYAFTFTSVFNCATRRKPLYFLLQLELDQFANKITRLLLPSVDEDGTVVRVDLIHRFLRERGGVN